MHWYELIGKTAGVISLLAFVPYWIAIVRGQTKPSRAGWWIWTLVGAMLMSSYYASGAEQTIWVPISYFFGPCVTAMFSLRYGEGGWSRFDQFCLVGAAASLVLWLAFDNPLIALIINLFIDFLGALPTIRKAWRNPAGEDKLAWTLFAGGNVLNLLAVPEWTFAVAAYPIYMLAGSGLIAALVIIPRKI